jgi:plasmid stability protein
MGTLIQIRDVPADAHRTLKARAALEGRTLSDYLRGELVALAGRPTPAEVWRRIRERIPVAPTEPPAQVIRRDRDERG